MWLTIWKGLCHSKMKLKLAWFFIFKINNSLVKAFYFHKYLYTFKLIKHSKM